MYKGIPVIVSAMPLSLSVSIAQGITEIRNGDVADADVINQNFSENNAAIDSLAGRLDPLEQKIQGLSHPYGNLEFRVTDDSSWSAAGVLSLYEKPAESITLDVGGVSFGPIQQSYSIPAVIFTQKGIRFNIQQVTRLYPPVSPPDVCPEDASIAFPLELYRIFHNEHGAILQATNWDFGEFNSPTPEALENSPSGTYICVGQSIMVVPNFVILGGVGRYRCAVTHPMVSTAPAEDIQDRFEYVAPQVDGLSVINMSANYAVGGAFISADIPETCDEVATEKRNGALPATINILGTTFVLPPIQSD